MNEDSFEKFTNRRKNKPSGFSKKQQKRNVRGNRHEQKQKLNDSKFSFFHLLSKSNNIYIKKNRLN